MMRLLKTGLACALAGILMSGAAAEAATISIAATSVTAGNLLTYEGLGDLGGGVGHGEYLLGTPASCSFDGTRTNCLVSGTYTEVAGSVNPGATGIFTFRTSWLGNVPNPIQARENVGTALLNDVVLHVVPPGAFFDLTLSGGYYGALDFGAQDTPNPGGGVLNWQASIFQPLCTGNPPGGCSVDNVGVAAGTTMSGQISPFTMQIDFPTAAEVPEPSTVILLGAGLAIVAFRRLRQ
jgi:hypothetical protein